jgi:dimethylargininase
VRILVRPPSDAFARALSTHADRSMIDAGRAVGQHAVFVAALRAAGLDVEALPAEPDLPDATFVSDTLLALPRADQPDGVTALLVVARPGAASRRGEVASVAERARRLVGRDAAEVQVGDPGTLDCGDVLVFGNRVAIGVSARTNVSGAGQVADAVRSAGYRAFLCPVVDRLHLASAVTALGPRRLVGTAAGFASLDDAEREAAPPAEVERILVSDEEAAGANVLKLGGTCFVAAGNPRTVVALRRAGEAVVEIPLDEFTRADGGPTCLVAILP